MVLIAGETMLLFLEISVVSILLAFLGSRPPVVVFWKTLERRHQLAFGIVLAFLIAGQAGFASRTTFPFIRWNMYTELNDAPEVYMGRIQVVRQDGTEEWLNSTWVYPSLARNFQARNTLLLRLQQEGKLTRDDPVTEIYRRLLLQMAKRYNDRSDTNPVQEIRGVLRAVSRNGSEIKTRDDVVTRVSLNVAKMDKGEELAFTSMERVQ
ncbi:MAG: hypothetical protein AAGA30_15920 [Planctomycetota bacterium]